MSRSHVWTTIASDGQSYEILEGLFSYEVRTTRKVSGATVYEIVFLKKRDYSFSDVIDFAVKKIWGD